jgi:hypothetical protein
MILDYFGLIVFVFASFVQNEFEALINDKRERTLQNLCKERMVFREYLFFEEVEKFKRIKSPKHLKNRASELCKNYIEPGSRVKIEESN